MGTDIEFGLEGAGFSTEQENYNSSVCIMAFDGKGKTPFVYESVVCYKGRKKGRMGGA